MRSFLLFVLAIILSSQAFATAVSWPPTTNQNTPYATAGTEPSGLIYEPVQNKIYFVSTNKVYEMNPDGSGLHSWTVSYSDLEGITITGKVPAGRTEPYLYIGQENTPRIAEFDPVSGTLTGKSWNMSAWIDATDTGGRMEGIAFVPDGHHPWGNTTRSGGIFLISMQDGHPATPDTAPIIAVDVDLSTSNVVSKKEEWVPVLHRRDISDLFYSTQTQRLYILYDQSNAMLIEKMDVDHTQVTEYTLPSTTLSQEALTFVPHANCSDADAYIGEDGTGKIWKINDFPFECISVPDGGTTGGTTGEPESTTGSPDSCCSSESGNSSGSASSSCTTGFSPRSFLILFALTFLLLLKNRVRTDI